MITFKVDNLKNMNDELKLFADFLRLAGAHDDDIFASKLVSCELITNVIVHGGDAADFECSLSGELIRITVSAESFKGLQFGAVRPAPLAESGRGMYIVKSLCCGEIENEDGRVSVCIKRK